MTHCGCVVVLMVIMFILLNVLILCMMCIFMIILMNNFIIIYSLKFLVSWIFMDLEIVVSIWGFMFLFMVLIISFSVLIFSFSYMNSLSVSNFIMLYLSFIISMLWLVLSNNFYWMMFGWDGLGVVSFMLIVFYMSNESVVNGLFTLFQNRLGDLFFVLFMLGTMQMIMINSMILSWGILFLILGGMVKSAQFPFNSWLLAAMSAPTPISSLVHSSTLVVAGVYILLQFSYCMVDYLEVLKFISIISLVISSFGLLNEMDMKKLIAYSTMSHVSLMMYLYSWKLFKVVYFHLNIHAMFKPLMFMCFGFLMLSSFHSQDKRLVSMVNLSPLVKMCYYFSCFCLMGLPFLSAFFSKDFIIEKMLNLNISLIFIVLLLLFLSVSIYYSFKLLSLSHVMFSHVSINKSILGMWSLLIMVFINISMINIYISLVFSLTLELVSSKMAIYFMMLLFGFLALLSNMNFKLMVYEKQLNFKEIWAQDLYLIDKVMYNNIYTMLFYVYNLSMIKLFVLFNWWIMVLVIFLY